MYFFCAGEGNSWHNYDQSHRGTDYLYHHKHQVLQATRLAETLKTGSRRLGQWKEN